MSARCKNCSHEASQHTHNVVYDGPSSLPCGLFKCERCIACYPAMMTSQPLQTLSPEQQLRNVAELLQQYTQEVRPGSRSRNQRPGSKRRITQYVADKETIAGVGHQLAGMVLAYLDNMLPAKKPDEFPF